MDILPKDLKKLINNFVENINLNCDECDNNNQDLTQIIAYQKWGRCGETNENLKIYLCEECMDTWVNEDGYFCDECHIWGNTRKNIAQYCEICDSQTCYECTVNSEGVYFCGCVTSGETNETDDDN